MNTPNRNASPPLKDLNSYAYWRETDERMKQFWYVSFCLMMSSVQDRLTGLALRESGNLNWATTAFYYSAVHAGRLVCFICSGDYPKRHTELADLLAPTPAVETETQRPPRRFHFDWLDEFLNYLRANVRNRADNTRTDRAALVSAIDATLPQVRSAFDQFAPLLAKFKKLRNDCNYEALLVAHEVNHISVTEGFNDLVAAACRASELAVNLAVAAYSEHLQSAMCFQRQRDQFHAAHTHYLCGRFELSLRQKFGKSATAMDDLRRIRDHLDWPQTPADIDVDAFLEPIVYDTFGEKRGLMERWRRDITILESSLPPRE